MTTRNRPDARIQAPRRSAHNIEWDELGHAVTVEPRPDACIQAPGPKSETIGLNHLGQLATTLEIAQMLVYEHHGDQPTT